MCGALAPLLADCTYDALVVAQPGAVSPRWMDLLWLAAYALLATACNDPSMRTLSEPPPDRECAPSVRQLYLLAAGSVLPGSQPGRMDPVVSAPPAGGTAR